jgi:hypothetical protein
MIDFLISRIKAGAVYHSICLQALRRLFVTVLSNQPLLQNPKTLIIMTIVQWIFSLTFCLPKLNLYPMISDICLGPFHRRYVFIHLSIAVYLIPIILLVVIYSIIIRYIKKILQHIFYKVSVLKIVYVEKSSSNVESSFRCLFYL